MLFRGAAADIVVAGRHEKDLSQKDVASYLDVHQSTYSRIESGRLVPTVYQWTQLCELFDIPLDSIKYNFIDRGSECTISSGLEERGFYLPEEYSANKCIKVRALLPLLCFIKKRRSSEKIREISKKMKISEFFFMDLDNQVNLKFLSDFLDEAGGPSLLSSIQDIQKFVPLTSSHGSLSRLYTGKPSKIAVLKEYISNVSKYYAPFIYNWTQIDENRYLLKVYIHSKISSASISESETAWSYLNHWRGAVLEELPEILPKKSQERVQISLLRSFEKGDDYTEYDIRVG